MDIKKRQDRQIDPLLVREADKDAGGGPKYSAAGKRLSRIHDTMPNGDPPALVLWGEDKK